MSGFTGVDWHLRTTEQMSADLYSGPGAARCFPAAAAWTQVAAACEEAGRELRAVSARLDRHWQAGPSDSVHAAAARLAAWFDDARESAQRVVEASRRQSVAVTTARVAMPNPAEIQIADAVATAAKSALPAVSGSLLAGPLTGAWAMADHAKKDQHRRAVRVMMQYEIQSTPLAAPWDVPRHPEVVRQQPVAKNEANQKVSKVARGGAATQAAAGGAVQPGPVPLGAYSPLTLPGLADTRPAAERSVGSSATSADTTARAASTAPASAVGAGTLGAGAAGAASAGAGGERARLTPASSDGPLPMPHTVTIPPVLGGPVTVASSVENLPVENAS